MLPTERKGVRWRVVPFNACRHSVECVSVRRLGFLRSIGRNKLFSIPLRGGRWRLPHRVFPSLLEGEYANATERGDLRLRPRMGPAPLSLPSGFGGGFQLRLKRTSARYDRARRPLDRVSGGVLRGRLQATHYGSAQACSRTNTHKDHGPTMPAGTTPHPHLPPMTRPSISHVSRVCRVGWKMPNAPATGLSSLKLGLDSTLQVYAYTNRG